MIHIALGLLNIVLCLINVRFFFDPQYCVSIVAYGVNLLCAGFCFGVGWLSWLSR